MAAKSGEMRETIEQAAQAGERFSELYYQTFDKSRHKMSKFYSANATVLWNGNVVKGEPDKLMDFFTNLPSSQHTLHSLDCQPVTDQAIPGHKTILVIAEGSVKYDGHKVENFSQNFLLTVEGTVWKVASDCFRYIE
ncbi:NTF2-related export protein 1-like [Actinia tenebrosa]|uniref:NTF2-related export protein n=1 Tax=Actinia tenebrosa TaxID=6105 RepID=A0A6P8J3J9_ACTTE|nr:NTF2-related export protein 1-like [Actinia tenebrosa]